MLRKVKSSLSIKISALLVGMIMLCAVTVGIASVTLYRSDSIEANANRALDIALSAAALIEPDEFTEIMRTLEKNDYWYTVKKNLDQITIRTNVAYLYVLDGNYSDSMTYFAEGFNDALNDEAEIDLGQTEDIVINGENVYADEMFDVLRDGVPRVSKVYESGDFGTMVSGFAPIIDKDGAVIGVIGVDLSVNEVINDTIGFGWRIALIILVFLVAFSILCAFIIRQNIRRPLSALTSVADQMADGDIDVNINTDRTDEIGVLAASFVKISAYTKLQVELLEQLAEGNLTMQVTSRGPRDAMSIALQHMMSKLNRLLADIKESAGQVSLGSQQIAAGAQDLADGSTEQSVMLQKFDTSLNEVLKGSKDNAGQAQSTYADTCRTGELMEKSLFSMGEMAQAMENINESSRQISKVIKVIDDIAFQTNILALNAAVEAAQAGQYGKGFAVVAEEVRALANKSAGAAQETTTLIQNSLSNVTEGNILTSRTKDQLKSATELAVLSANAVRMINEASQRQTQTISDITKGISQISLVVQANSATAEQSAASAQEISLQAQKLHDALSQFKIQ
ncbi:MAG TPA: methyl-accepting chemotaxis protein [Clostridiales bacterium]|nr:methyl-accepting chemotaxis protein [Clostridiales bacterium]